MGRGGHNRVSKERKVIRGTFRPGREPVDPIEADPLPKAPRAPAHLSKHAKRLWRELAPQLVERGILTALDLATFEMLCAAYGMYREAEEAVFFTTDENGTKRRRTLGEYMEGRNAHTAPELTAMKTAHGMYKTYLAEFGMGPLARTRIDIKPTEKTADPMIELLNGDLSAQR